jgi:hypothetical protein
MINTITGNYTLEVNDSWRLLNLQEIYLQCNTSLGAVNIDLFEIINLAGFWNVKIYITDISNNASVNNIVVNASGSDIIDSTGTTSSIINVNGGSLELQVVGDTQWLCLEGNTSGGGGGIGGTNYVFVRANGTDLQNAAELQAAYVTAQGMSPSATNRVSVVTAPGKYNFGSSPFVMNTQHIDLVSLDGNRSVIFNSSNTSGTISVTANNVFIKGVDVSSSNKNFTIATNLNLLRVENCKGGDFSFGGDTSMSGANIITVSGTFLNCEGGAGSFAGYDGIASGIFINCVGNCALFGFNGSFGGDGTASGTFTECVSKGNSFGGSLGLGATGVFTRCVNNPPGSSVGTGGFGIGGFASGTFINCRAQSGSFGITANGVFIDCQAGANAFGDNLASGIFTNCQAFSNAFGGNGTASGTFTNCVSGFISFGGFNDASGIFTNCIAGDNSFGGANIVGASGVFTNCVAGNNSFGGVDTMGGSNGIASGIFTDCISGDNSFGGSAGTASGAFTNCQAGITSFGGVTGISSGTFIDCVASDTSFGGTATGVFTNCLSGLGSFGGGGSAAASGAFTNCVAGDLSFGAFGTLDGQLYFCRLTTGLFPTVSGAGRTIYCIDGSNNTNNQ